MEYYHTSTTAYVDAEKLVSLTSLLGLTFIDTDLIYHLERMQNDGDIVSGNNIISRALLPTARFSNYGIYWRLCDPCNKDSKTGEISKGDMDLNDTFTGYEER